MCVVSLFFHAQDGIREGNKGLEFKRVLFRSKVKCFRLRRKHLTFGFRVQRRKSAKIKGISSATQNKRPGDTGPFATAGTRAQRTLPRLHRLTIARRMTAPLSAGTRQPRQPPKLHPTTGSSHPPRTPPTTHRQRAVY